MFASVSVHASPEQEKTWLFTVTLDDREIGYHEYRVTSDKESRWVRSKANFDVRFLFFTAYEYQHSAAEFWQGECIKSISSETNDNGTKEYLEATVRDEKLWLNNNTGEQQLYGCVRSFAYWDKELLRASHLLNPQTGEYLAVELVEKGESSLQMNGKQITARHYTLQLDESDINLWYSEEGEWLALQTNTDNGYTLTYTRSDEEVM